MRHAADDLAERLSAVDRRFGQAAALFCQTPAAMAAITASGKVQSVLRVECDACFASGADTVLAPFETVPLEPESIDLAISLMSLQTMNDIPGMLVQIRRALKPDGLFLGAMAGAGTLAELRESLLAAETELHGGISPRISPFVDVRDAGALLQRAGFALPVADIETMTETNVLADRSRRPATRALFARAAEIYAERFSDPDGRIRASFPVVWLSGWAPDASQQKPLKPGSAKMSLAEALQNSTKQ
jgi:SAM-dependent methyltransferase